jgi:hypothetical protein
MQQLKQCFEKSTVLLFSSPLSNPNVANGLNLKPTILSKPL